MSLERNAVAGPHIKLNMVRSKRTKAFNDLVNEVADDTGLTAVDVTRVLFGAFSNMSDRMARGEAVCVPAFGTFGPLIKRPKNGDPPYCYPGFFGAHALKMYVRNCCTVSWAGALDLWKRAKQGARLSHHTTDVSRTLGAAPTPVVQRKWRRQVEKEGRRLGIWGTMGGD